MAINKRIFCDTNFLLDLFDVQRKRHYDAVAMLWYCSDNAQTVQLLASISSFKDAYYILSRLYQDKDLARSSVESVMGRVIQPVDILSSYGAEALGSDEPDFEDGLIRVCAEHENATVLITSDKKAFKGCAIPALTADAFLEQEGFDFEVIDF